MKQKTKAVDTKLILTNKKYTQAIGRRKTSTAIARLYDINSLDLQTDFPTIIVNNKNYQTYFKIPEYINNVISPLTLLNLENKYFISLKCKGGGISAQSEAARLAIARALTLIDLNYRDTLKKAGFLKRDPRSVERKKWGFRKARKKPQWQKR